GPDRRRTVGAWSGLGGVATAIGPVLGGFLVGLAPWGWRLAFLINVPLAVLVVLLAVRTVPETRDEQADARPDVTGAVLAAAGLALAVYALTVGPQRGWSGPVVGCLLAGLALLIAFLLTEARSSHPMMPLALFRDRDFSGANAVTLVVYAALSGALFLIPVQLQRVSGFSPVEAGSALLPITVVMLLLSARMGRLATGIGPRLPMTVGPVVAGAGLALLVRVGPHASYVLDLLPALLVFSLGLSATVAPLTATVLAAAPHRQAGVASAVNNDIARVAGLLAVAVLPGLAGITPSAYDDAARLSAGFHHAVLIAGALCAFGGVLSFLTIRRRPDPAGSAAADAPTPRSVPTHCAISAPPAPVDGSATATS
ncbi:MAG: MFS transporter, partial [Jatrophihabitans sp.]